MYAAEERGDVPEGTAARWEKETTDKDLPEKVAELVVLAAIVGPRTTTAFTQAPTIQNSLKTIKSRQSMHAGTTHKGFAEHVSAGISTPKKPPTTMPNRNIKLAENQLVPGGKGRNKKPSDFDAKEIRIGLKVEQEHFVGGGMSDQELHDHAMEIVLDHLAEDEHYYTKTKHDFKEEIKKEAMSGKAKALLGLTGLAAGIGGVAMAKALSKPDKAPVAKGVKVPSKRLINAAIRSGKGDFNVEYTKADGTVVQRKVRPITAKGKVIVVHDYDRNAIRSFRTDRLSKLEKAAALDKAAGGPGSGVKGDNTLAIGLPMSKYVSVGTRKALLDNMPYYEDTVPMSQITAVGQEKYVPEKLNRMMNSPEDVLSKPIHLLRIADNDDDNGSDEYHVIDGHHRYLVARAKGVKEIHAKVYTKRAD
jgi:hypothetical protein